MKRVWIHTLAVAFGIAVTVLLAAAQRSNTATYDSTRQVKLQGPVTRIDWVNPRAFLFVDVKDANGTVMNWAVDFGNPLELERDGWKKSSLHIGDVVTVEGTPARSESREALAKTVVLTSSGKRLFGAPAVRPAATAPLPTPRWPDNQVRFGPAPGKKGYWGAPSSRVLVDDKSGKIPMNDDGLLLNITTAEQDQDAAQFTLFDELKSIWHLKLPRPALRKTSFQRIVLQKVPLAIQI
jgi:hypothetical protein